MMKKYILITALALTSLCSNAQQALWGGSQIVSPEINPDKTVTFRLSAPKAVKVQLTGDFLPTQKVQTPFGEFDAPGTADMVEKDGVWQYTTPAPLAPELYSYTMLVDGLKINDPSNVHRIRDVQSISDVFIIDDSESVTALICIKSTMCPTVLFLRFGTTAPHSA